MGYVSKLVMKTYTIFEEWKNLSDKFATDSLSHVQFLLKKIHSLNVLQNYD